ncbi:MAG: (2Fe-2S)-binding protein [Betaproteobacteria bacterium SG8_39]|nr:MAG: (2Fe-2S)-binding protein [Betaproteobacteria bacterium SG8_39]
MALDVNDRRLEVDAEPEMPLLWVLRDLAGLTGSKFACGIGACGACTVLIDGHPVRSCVFPVSGAVGKRVRTIESVPDRVLRTLQQVWIEEQVPQCGYCQSGMLMAAAGLLNRHPEPTEVEINRLMTNLCRCGTYPRVRAAIQRAARLLQGERA